MKKEKRREKPCMKNTKEKLLTKTSYNLNRKCTQQEHEEVELCTACYLSQLVTAVRTKPVGFEFEFQLA